MGESTMAYAINSDVQQRLGAARYVQLTDDTGSGSANEALVTEARDGAEGEINSYLSQRYGVPINLATYPEVAAVLKSVTLDLTEYRLYARRREIPAEVAARRTAAIEWLTRVATGKTSLPSVTAIGPNPAAGTHAAVRGDERMLSREELGGW